MKLIDQPSVHFFPKKDEQGKRWALGDQGKAALDEICRALNSETSPELKMHLRRLLRMWMASGPNLNKMLQHQTSLSRLALMNAMRIRWFPTDGGRAELFLLPDYEELERLLGRECVWQTWTDDKKELMPDVEALALFHLLTVIPGGEKIAGPCPRCGRYYIKKRKSQKVYCSRRCGNAATAMARTRVLIARKRSDKLTRAEAALKEWECATPRQDWKHWVAKKTGIDMRFLTRAVTKGDLVPPKKEK